MAELDNTNPTFLDLQKILHPDGSVLPVAEVLNETNEGIMEWMSWQEGNLPTGHMHAVATSLPTVSYGQLYQGVTATKGTNKQVTDTTMQFQSLSEVDCRLIDMSSNPAATRWIYDRKHIEAMRQDFFDKLFYGDPATDPRLFRGLTPRYSDITDANSENIIEAADAPVDNNDIESIWLVGWSPATIFGIIPKNAPGGPGIQMEDRGKTTLENGDGNNGRLDIYRTYFQMWSGLAVTDWRYAVRICNIKPSTVNADPADGGPNIIEIAKEAIERIPMEAQGVRLAFYASRFLRQRIRQQYANSVKNSTLTMDNVGGLSPRAKVGIDGVPVYRVDALASSNSGGEAVL